MGESYEYHSDEEDKDMPTLHFGVGGDEEESLEEEEEEIEEEEEYNHDEVPEDEEQEEEEQEDDLEGLLGMELEEELEDGRASTRPDETKTTGVTYDDAATATTAGTATSTKVESEDTKGQKKKREADSSVHGDEKRIKLADSSMDKKKGKKKHVTMAKSVDTQKEGIAVEEPSEHVAPVVDLEAKYDEIFKSFPRNPLDNTILVDELSMEQRKVYNAKVMSLLTENQMDRYECFRRSSLKEPMRRLIQVVVGSGNPKNTDKIVIALAGVAKIFVGELVEEARRIAESRGEHGPLSPDMIHEAYSSIHSQGLARASTPKTRRMRL